MFWKDCTILVPKVLLFFQKLAESNKKYFFKNIRTEILIKLKPFGKLFTFQKIGPIYFLILNSNLEWDLMHRGKIFCVIISNFLWIIKEGRCQCTLIDFSIGCKLHISQLCIYIKLLNQYVVCTQLFCNIFDYHLWKTLSSFKIQIEDKTKHQNKWDFRMYNTSMLPSKVMPYLLRLALPLMDSSIVQKTTYKR